MTASVCLAPAAEGLANTFIVEMRGPACDRNRHMIDQPPELQLLYETAPVGLAFLSPDCRYLQINRHLTEICGISVADHIGRSVRDTVPQVADQVEHIVQTILRTGEPIIGIEVSGQRPDGGNAERVWLTASVERHRRYHSWHQCRCRGNHGAQAGRSGARGKRSSISRACRQHEPICLDDRCERPKNLVQQAMVRLYGNDWQKLVHPDHIERVNTRIRESHDSGKPWEDTYPLQGRDGNFRWFLTRAMPIRNERGDVVRWFGTNTDVTQQVE